MIQALTFFAMLFSLDPGVDSRQRMFAVDGVESVIRLDSVSEDALRFQLLGESVVRDQKSVDSIQFSAGQYVPEDQLQIRLVDGSILMVKDFLVSEERVLQVLSEGAVKNQIAIRNISSLALVPVTRELSDRWQQLSDTTEQTSDWLIFDRDGSLDFIEGSAGVISGETISFRLPDRSAEAPRQRVSGVAFFHPVTRTLSDPVAIMSLVNGSQLNLRSLQRDAQDDQFLATTVCGAELRLPADEIFKVDFAALRFQYLSRLSPSTIDWKPIFFSEAIYEYQAQLNRPRFDRSFTNQPLGLEFSDAERSLRVESFEHGIAMKGGTRIVFPLQGRYSRLEGWVGFSPDAPMDGQVNLVVAGDGNELLQRVLKHETDPPIRLDLDISEVNRLTLRVEYQDGRNIGDVIHFCDLKVSR